jgi:hypothetical protein
VLGRREDFYEENLTSRCKYVLPFSFHSSSPPASLPKPFPDSGRRSAFSSAGPTATNTSLRGRPFRGPALTPLIRGSGPNVVKLFTSVIV